MGSIFEDGMVVHVLGPHEFDLYVGRAAPRCGLKEGEWANPYRIGAKLDGTREEVLEMYEAAARHWLEDPHKGPTLREELSELRGKTLACWCARRGSYLEMDDPLVCHAQILLRLAKEIGEDG